jgi:dipicolinate synthase subunit A
VSDITFCGGDKRELFVMNAFMERGYHVMAYGCAAELLPPGVEAVEDIQAAFAKSAACILPQPPIKMDGQIHSLRPEPVYLRKEDFDALPANTPVLCGVASPFLRYAAGHCRIFELVDDDRLALLLAPATAEGALAEAIAISGGMLFGSRALLIGFGRIGRELAWRLEALGMELTVLNRGSERRREAIEMGFNAVDRSQLVDVALNADYIFNTAPAPILDEVIVGLLHRETCIVDLAAYPGGTDFAAAARRGIRAMHAGGMPGKYAAEYAGQTMAGFIPSFLEGLFS